MAENFSEKIKRIRKWKGMTQQEVAEELRVSRSCIANYENGSREPDLAIVRKLAELYGVGVEDLMGSKTVRNMIEHLRRREMPTQLEEMVMKQKTLDLKPLDAESRVAILNFYKYLYDRGCESSDVSVADI